MLGLSRLFFVFIVVSIILNVSAFSPETYTHRGRSRGAARTEICANNYKVPTEAEMQDIIYTLSEISDDQQRRDELQRTFDGASTEFAKIFEKELIVVGNQVQEKAQKQAAEEVASVSEDYSKEESSLSSIDGSKSNQQKQLWALVDMMVQSKLIIKKSLGSFE